MLYCVDLYLLLVDCLERNCTFYLSCVFGLNALGCYPLKIVCNFLNIESCYRGSEPVCRGGPLHL